MVTSLHIEMPFIEEKGKYELASNLDAASNSIWFAQGPNNLAFDERFKKNH